MKRSINWFWGLGILLSASCGGQEIANLLSHDQMVEILTEFHLADAHVSKNTSNIRYRDYERDLYYDAILNNAKIDRETFYASYDYYIDHPVELDTIYQRIIRDVESRMDKRHSNPREYDEPNSREQHNPPASSSQR